MAAPLLQPHTCALVIRVWVCVVAVSSMVNHARTNAQIPHESLQICRKNKINLRLEKNKLQHSTNYSATAVCDINPPKGFHKKTLKCALQTSLSLMTGGSQLTQN